MALLVFPPTPLNGDIYPVSPPVGTNIYQWSAVDQTWRLLGPSTGVTPGVYGSSTLIPQITVDATGRITLAQNIPISVGTVSSVDASGGTTGLTFSGGPITTTGVLTLGGRLAIANGGTGATTANDALNALLPAQTGNTGFVLQTDGANTSWVDGSTIFVSLVGTGTGLTGGPITTTGTISLDLTYTDGRYLQTTGGTMTGTTNFATGSSLIIDAGASFVMDGGATFNGTTQFNTAPTFGPGVSSSSAAQVTYSNATSGLTATNVQAAIDEVDGIAGAALPKAGGTMTGNITFNLSQTFPGVAKIITVPTSSADPGTLGDVAFGTGFFYWFDGIQWLRVAGSTF